MKRRSAALGVLVALCLAAPSGWAEVLTVGASNDVYFRNFENLYSAQGQYKAPGSTVVPGDHLVGVINAQYVEADGVPAWFQSPTDQVTGVLAQRVEAVLYPDPFDPAQVLPHLVLGPPAATTFCKGTDCFSTATILGPGEMIAFFRQTGTGMTLFEYNGSLADDVAKASDGARWLTVGYSGGLVAAPDGYFYSHVSLGAPLLNFTGEAWAGLKAIVNNTGHGLCGVNDPSELELGGDTLMSSLVLSSELEGNPDSVNLGKFSPWDYRSNDPATLLPCDVCGVEITKTPDPTDTPQPVFSPGDTAYFDITVTNPNNACTARGVTIDDDLPAGADGLALTWTEAEAACSIVAQHLHCEVGDLAGGQSFTVHVEATIPVPAAAIGVAALAGTAFNATDGNLLLDNAELMPWLNVPDDSKDWKTFAGAIDCDANQGCVRDTPSGSGDTSYVKGAKEDDPNPSIEFGSIPPSKDDLMRWYFVQDFLGAKAFLYLAWVRTNQLATATIDFELNQSGIQQSNGINPVRTEGDVLIVYDFRGGRVDELGLLRWLTTADPTNTDADCEASGSTVAAGCWGRRVDLLGSGLAEGAVNFNNFGTNKPGDDGYPVYDPIEGVTLDMLRFGEAAVNLTDAIGAGEECVSFAQAFVKSRASSSFPAELKDLIGPVPVQLSTCLTVPNTATADGSNVEAVSDDGGFYVKPQ